MTEKSIVFNDQLELFGERYITRAAPIPSSENPSLEFQKQKILALLFEQFLLFDKIAFKLDRQSLALYFLIKELGINKVEELIENDLIKLVLWTPQILTVTGTQREDKSIDHSTVIGRPPLIFGSFTQEDSDPEKNIDDFLKKISIHKDRKKIFKKKALKNYILPNNKIAEGSIEIILDSYKKNRLKTFGLEANKEPENLDYIERAKLSELGNQILETAVLAEKGFKSYDNYSYFSLTKESVQKIESAYHVSENTSKIFEIEGLADIQALYLENRIPFNRVFDIRYKPDIKNYRKWINSVSIKTDATNISKQYIDEIDGTNKFSQSPGGKFLRTVGMFGVGVGIGSLASSIPGAIVGGGLGKVADLTLSLLDDYILEGILKGWNPRLFVNHIKKEARLDYE